MAKVKKAQERTAKQRVARRQSTDKTYTPAVPTPRVKKSVTALSQNQKEYMRLIARKRIVFGVGPAGTGKTYLACAAAAWQLANGKVDRIILVRPAVEAGGEKLGFLPGDIAAKFDPYMRPLVEALREMIDEKQVRALIDAGSIEVAPLAFMRGRTLTRAFVILDESQNSTPEQMRMLLTRLGKESRIVITGDLTQVDLPAGKESGLRDALDTFSGEDFAGVQRFTEDDSEARDEIVRLVLKAYAKRRECVAQDAA